MQRRLANISDMNVQATGIAQQWLSSLVLAIWSWGNKILDVLTTQRETTSGNAIDGKE